MWPFSSYPVHQPSQIDGKAYDYVIIGGGTAGCVVASRLSEDPTVSVLLIDKGHVRDNAVSRVPLVSQNMFLGDVLQVQGDRWTEPMPGANRRRNRLWAVEGIGGASRMNAMLWTRGYPGDYAAWSELGLQEWSYEKLEPYFRKMENVVDHVGSTARGREGSLPDRAHRIPFQEAAHKLGLRPGQDINDPAAPAMAFFELDVAIDKHGNRVSALSAYLNKTTVYQRRNHLAVCTGAVASRLEADTQAGIITRVHFRSSEAPHKEYFVKARREVIVCAGAACTPQLLLLSGIGPSDPTKKLGIPIVKELPGVGATLSDHYSIPIMLEVPKKETFHFLESIWGIWHFLLWLIFGKGMLSIGSMSSSFYIRSGALDLDTMKVKEHDDAGRDNLDGSLSSNVPDIEVMFMPNSAVEREVQGHTLMSIYPTLVQPQGSGRVELSSTDALAQPRITYPMFTNDHDIATARLAVRFAMRLAEELKQSDYPYPAKLLFAPGQDPTALAEWEKAAPAEYVPIPVPSPGAGQQKAKPTLVTEQNNSAAKNSANIPLIAAVQKQYHALSWYPLMGSAISWIAGTSKDINELMARDVDTEAGFLVGINKASFPALAPGPSLDAMNTAAIGSFADVIDSLAIRGPRQILLLPWVRSQIFLGTTDAIYGPHNPFRDPSVAEAWSNFRPGIPNLGPKALPSFLTTHSIRAREHVIQALMSYFRSGHYKSGSALLLARYAYIVDKQGIEDLEDLARFELAGAFASIENTVPTTFWFLSRIFSDPTVLKDCREELTPLVKARNGVSYVDVDSIKASCPIIQSTLHETIRYHSVVISARKVTQDHLLDKYLLKKGSTLLISATVPHFDPGAWGADAVKFKHTRFVQRSDEVPRKGGSQRMAFRGFGGGYHLCPGRHFSVTEMLSLAAMVILRFDVTPVAGTWDALGKDEVSSDGTAAPVPAHDFPVMFSPRSHGKWVFLVSGTGKEIELLAE
ncbi:hypothetical protein PG993_004007 [Apiospora rasikravindrae]|uniref:Glucose-methanol-choline oxidoreductase N-terminal domain-containing protein n=1 Tax=Apiospora rasikravindrae TaxID=990691 RepID=A0ABR1TE73_9PEZI